MAIVDINDVVLNNLILTRVSGQQTLATQLGELLLAKHWQVSCAESCTGGGIAAAITSVAGSSAWFKGSFVTYSNDFKHKLLGVSEQTLMTCGAVSEAVVREMAVGALHKTNAQIAVAVSGIAGPTGGTAGKPVGTVWLAWATAAMVSSQVVLLSGNRQKIRNDAEIVALHGLIETIKIAT